MRDTVEKYRSDLKRLAASGEGMLIDLSLRQAAVGPEMREAAERLHGCFERDYQRWYTEACAAVGQLLPGRLDEFQKLYLGDGRRKTIDADTYTIQDWLVGRRVAASEEKESADSLTIVSLRLKAQLDVLRSAEARFESSLFDIRHLVQADMFDSQLDECRELSEHGFLRAAGSIAGVILERHLRQVLVNHEIDFQKSEPTLNDFNDQLKRAGLVDVPAWRQIQRLADVRNLCSHSKQREPHKKEVDELIDGVDRVVRSLF
jgi:hypothetical protein